MQGRRFLTALFAASALLLCLTFTGRAAAALKYIYGNVTYADQEVWGTSKPARGVAYTNVTVRHNGVPLAGTLLTNPAGSYGGWFDLPDSGSVSISFSSTNQVADVYKASAWNSSGDATSSAIRSWTSGSVAITTANWAFVSMNVTAADDAALLNILDVAWEANKYAVANRDSTETDAIPKVKIVHWDPNNNVKYASHYTYSATTPTMHIGKAAAWQDGQIAHEYGHHLQYHISRASPGGNGYCEPNGGNFTVAWHEGFPQFFAGAVLGQPYWGQWTANCTLANSMSNPPCAPGDAGVHMEAFNWNVCFDPGMSLAGDSVYSTWESLWDVFDGPGEWHDRLNGGANYGGFLMRRHLLQIFDKEMDHKPDGTAETLPMDIKLFHNKFRDRNLYAGSHADLDRVFAVYGTLGHSRPDYYPAYVNVSTTNVNVGGSLNITIGLGNLNNFYYTDEGVRIRIVEHGPNYNVQRADFTVAGNAWQVTQTVSVFATTNATIGYSVEVDYGDRLPESSEWNNTGSSTSVSVHAYCGDAYCNGGEWCGSCENDCGECPPCGNGVCGSGESCWNCPEDCDPCDSTGSCFVAGTPITMADGSTLPIEKVAVGDRVLAFDEETGALVPGEVLELLVHENSDQLVVVNDTLVTTAMHPFYVDGKWVRADSLNVGDTLLRVDPGTQQATPLTAQQRVHHLESRPGRVTTYNFEVRRYHTYFAGGVLVHNIKPSSGVGP